MLVGRGEVKALRRLRQLCAEGVQRASDATPAAGTGPPSLGVRRQSPGGIRGVLTRALSAHGARAQIYFIEPNFLTRTCSRGPMINVPGQQLLSGPPDAGASSSNAVPSCFKAIAMSLLSPSGVADVGRVRSKCSFVGQLNELAASVKADPKDYRTWPIAIGRLRGHRDETKGIEWLFSREVYDRLDLDPRERRRSWTRRRVANGMKANGWKRQYVGPRSARESGFCRALGEHRAAGAVPASPHHRAAVEAFRIALETLANLGMSGAQLDRAFDAARECDPV